MTEPVTRTWHMVPATAEECAAHLEAGGVVEFNNPWDGLWRPSTTSAEDFGRSRHGSLRRYRLVYSAPVGMSPVPGSPGYAVGEARFVPDGWEWRESVDYRWCDPTSSPTRLFVEARPPQLPPEPATELVPLTRLVGRTLKGETKPIDRIEWVTAAASHDCRARWRWHPKDNLYWQDFPDGVLDIESGCVEVLAEGER